MDKDAARGGGIFAKFFAKKKDISTLDIEKQSSAQQPKTQQIELAKSKEEDQRRTAFRMPLLKDELKIERFWIHNPGAKFSKSPLGPENSALMLERGVYFENLSSTGALFSILVPKEINILELSSLTSVQTDLQGAQDTQNEDEDTTPLRDASFIIKLRHAEEMTNIMVCGNIVRVVCLRVSSKASLYSLGVHFNLWANTNTAGISWHKTLDVGIPPIASWISRRQFSKKHAEKQTRGLYRGLR